MSLIWLHLELSNTAHRRFAFSISSSLLGIAHATINSLKKLWREPLPKKCVVEAPPSPSRQRPDRDCSDIRSIELIDVKHGRLNYPQSRVISRCPDTNDFCQLNPVARSLRSFRSLRGGCDNANRASQPPTDTHTRS